MLGDALFPVDAHQLGAKLPVDHGPVTDDDHSVDIRLIDHPLGKPRDGFGLAAAGAVPDQIAAAHALFLHILLTAEDSPQLVEAREDHGALVVDEHELPDDAQQHILLQDPLPDIKGAVLPRLSGVARALVLGSAVEGQELGLFAVQARGQIGGELIQRKVHQCAAIEGEDQLVGIPRCLELLGTLKNRLLPGGLLFQLDHHEGNAVQEQREIHAVGIDLVLKAELFPN